MFHLNYSWELDTRLDVDDMFFVWQVSNFFCVGSPLAVFLALRGVRPEGGGTQDHILPKSLTARLFNIYHPYDPVVSEIGSGAHLKIHIRQDINRHYHYI